MQHLEVPMLRSLGHTVLRCLHLNFTEQARDEVARRNAEADNHVVKRFSRGSVGLQAGKYLSQSDMDAEKAKLRRKLRS